MKPDKLDYSVARPTALVKVKASQAGAGLRPVLLGWFWGGDALRAAKFFGDSVAERPFTG
jgi:hypothetical protein